MGASACHVEVSKVDCDSCVFSRETLTHMQWAQSVAIAPLREPMSSGHRQWPQTVATVPSREEAKAAKEMSHHSHKSSCKNRRPASNPISGPHPQGPGKEGAESRHPVRHCHETESKSRLSQKLMGQHGSQ